VKSWPIKIGGQERAVSLHNGNFYRHGGGVELNLSSSRKYALALGQFLSKVGAFHWPPKTTILWVLALRCISLLDAMCDYIHQQKWGIPNTLSWWAKVLKSFCAPLAPKFTYKKRSGGKLGCGVMDSPRTHKQLCINKINIFGLHWLTTINDDQRKKF
jgi:hypothetical protein